MGLIERGILGVTLFSIATTLRNSIAQWSTDCLIGHIHFRDLFLYKFDFSTREKRRIRFCEPARRYRWSNFWLFEKTEVLKFLFCKTFRTVKNFLVSFVLKKMTFLRERHVFCVIKISWFRSPAAFLTRGLVVTLSLTRSEQKFHLPDSNLLAVAEKSNKNDFLITLRHIFLSRFGVSIQRYFVS